MGDVTQQDIQAFIDRWHASGAAERANYQLFLSELCDIIDVAHPQPASENPHQNAYVFEKRVPSTHGTTNFIDLYKRSCFVLEAKQGSDKPETGQLVFSEAALRRKKQRKKGTAVRGTKSWDTAMEKARQQAQTYARSLPSDEISNGRPPFIIVVDVGNTIALYSEFSRTGGNYIPFPDPSSYRLKLHDLHDANVRQLLRQVWDDPMSLDPARRSAKVTREIAARLAELAKSLEGSSNAEMVAQFLMRCLFTMFAEDVGLLPERSFTQLLDDMRRDPASFKPMLEHLWQTMDSGGFSVILRHQIPKFNGGLFADQTALPLTLPQIELLVEAAKADWRDVEPAIFGTLLERALDPVERHKLGAHYTPRAYVERLVKPTIIEPLRAEWESVQAAALLYAESDQPKKAIAEVEAFHVRLATIRILDPACGSGNFLYVTLEHLKRLEGEVLNTMQELGEKRMKLEIESVTVSPQQFLGIEVNPRAAAIAELVLWIGYLQWHYRTRGNAPHAEPIIKDFHNIECRDAVLAWDGVEPLLDENGQPVTRWDGRSTKPHPITGEEVPDETAILPDYKYINPRQIEWPEVDFIIGNPPFVGNKRMRFYLGDGYTDAVRDAYSKHIPKTADYVMFWWWKAAEMVRSNNLESFGLITTNSLTQVFNRSIVEKQLREKTPISLAFGIPDHPWVDSSDGASVRIAMTTGVSGDIQGKLQKVVSEISTETDDVEIIFDTFEGKIFADLTVGVDVNKTFSLKSNQKLASQGANPLGLGFRLTPHEVVDYGFALSNLPSTIRPYRIGRDLVQREEEKFVIDFTDYSEQEAKQEYPILYQHLFTYVKPERDQNRRKTRRENWWLFGENAPMFRNASKGLNQYIATCRTAKHRIFTTLPVETIPDAKIVAIALKDNFCLGVLSSKIHVVWAMRTGGWLGVGNDSNYNHSDCFGKFPFPDATEAQKARIRALTEQLDAHRKRQQAQHPSLTLTAMYNVLEKVRAFEQQLPGSSKLPGSLVAPNTLTAKETTIHEQGLISILKQIHDDLDEAVFAAYGWSSPSPSTGSGSGSGSGSGNAGIAEPVEAFSDEEILQRLVDLNAQRAAEEANGHVRWLRPAYQAPDEVQAQQAALLEVTSTSEVPVTLAEKQDWPKALKDRATAVRAVLAAFEEPVGVAEVAGGFNGRRTKKRLDEVAEILEMLVALGQIEGENGRYS